MSMKTEGIQWRTIETAGPMRTRRPAQRSLRASLAKPTQTDQPESEEETWEGRSVLLGAGTDVLSSVGSEIESGPSS